MPNRSTSRINGVQYSASVENGSITNSRHLVCEAFLEGQEVGIYEPKMFIRDPFDRTALDFRKRMRGLRVQGSPHACSTEPLNEPERLVFDLFDHNGRFGRKFYEHSVAKGKGIRDSHLKQRTTLLVKFRVEPFWRG